MTTEQIKEGNRLLAEFMGWKITGTQFRNIPDNYKDPNDSDNILSIDDFEYHSSWDWLMPVVQKIKATDTGLDVYSLYVEDSLRTANIKEVYEAVIDFIKNYNEKIKKPHELS